MNKLIKIIVVSLILIFTACVTNKRNVTVSQKKTSLPVILSYNQEYDVIWRIKIPILLEFANNSDIKRKLDIVQHINTYNSRQEGIIPYREDNKKLKEPIYINERSKKEIIFYTQHTLDTSKTFQKKFNNYLKEMKIRPKENISAGSFEEFKLKHTILLGKLLSKDSLKVSFFVKEPKPVFEKPIKIPLN
ncbi:hypothetical protein LX95_02856 [Mesonia algae]|uniref:Lipoprotein n=1 Tax=Mesonia algae TaxID=213248 RepID=A0A2W7HWD2_9FLAO|nr:hypothetical protein [Mesonia algae]PZW37665.1 hypothetical protein LX95_02856 [Mesonia algae]